MTDDEHNDIKKTLAAINRQLNAIAEEAGVDPDWVADVKDHYEESTENLHEDP